MNQRNQMENGKGTHSGERIFDLSSMPEGVIAYILSLTTPSDVCRSSAVSGTFYAAAQSDVVWNRFLPTDWEFFISRRKPGALNFDPISSSKKEIFFSLCDTPLLIDDGNKSFSLDKWGGGKKCIMLGARELKIIWSESPFYWNWEPHPDSRFAEVAVLIYVWWFDIHGKISCKMLSPGTTYAAYFVFKMDEQTYCGFDIVPTDAKVGIVTVDDDQCCTNPVCLDPYLKSPQRRNRPHYFGRMGQRDNNMSRLERRPKKRQDGWFEIELGEFQSGDSGDDEVEMSLLEIHGKSSKSGLVVEGIEIRPKLT